MQVEWKHFQTHPIESHTLVQCKWFDRDPKIYGVSAGVDVIHCLFLLMGILLCATQPVKDLPNEGTEHLPDRDWKKWEKWLLSQTWHTNVLPPLRPLGIVSETPLSLSTSWQFPITETCYMD